jgi:uncharacterized protein (DUF1697 family)
MDKHIALLRAVNVGNRPVPMKALSALFTELGARDVVTYIQSGNVVFSPPTKKKLDASTLARAIEARFGFAVPVVLRTHAELAACAANNPFLLRGEDRKAAHVYFLSAPPRAALAASDHSPERPCAELTWWVRLAGSLEKESVDGRCGRGVSSWIGGPGALDGGRRAAGASGVGGERSRACVVRASLWTSCDADRVVGEASG